MSILKLLADFPNYSARKVRRLAVQISTLHSIELPVGKGSGALKGIEDDLIDYNLLLAKTEERLNDDLAQPVAKTSEKLVHPDAVTERINVCPTAAARRVMDEYRNWIIKSMDITGLDFDAIEAKCRGIINGQCFYTDRTVIMAKLSPQDSLPLDNKQ